MSTPHTLLVVPVTFPVSETAGVGAEVGVVTATDLDSGSFGEVTYNITGGNEVRGSTISRANDTHSATLTEVPTDTVCNKYKYLRSLRSRKYLSVFNSLTLYR